MPAKASSTDGAELPNIAPETYVDRLPFNVPMTIFWVPGVWTLTEAKKRAAVMLEACAVGVCMGNGADELKALADYVTDDINACGLSNAFKKFGII